MRFAAKFVALFAFGLVVDLQSARPATPSSAAAQWAESWGASQQIPEPQNSLPPDDLHDATLRQIFHLSIGGSTLRIHLSNAFGTEALHFTSVHIARPITNSAAAVDPATDRLLTFAGSADVTRSARRGIRLRPARVPRRRTL